MNTRIKTPPKPAITSASRPLTFEVEAINERGEAMQHPSPVKIR